MTKLEKARLAINERFRQSLPQKFHEKFGVRIVTEWSFLEMAVYSQRVDGKPLTDEQRMFIDAFDCGYAQSLIVLDELIQ